MSEARREERQRALHEKGVEVEPAARRGEALPQALLVVRRDPHCRHVGRVADDGVEAEQALDGVGFKP